MKLNRRQVVGTILASSTVPLVRVQAQQPADNVVRIGVLEDMSGPYRDISGPTSISLAQIARLAIERDQLKRNAYILRIGQYEPQQLVFIDESSVDRKKPH